METKNKPVREAVLSFLDGYARKDLSACMSCFAESSPLMIFGTNVDEVFTSRQDLQAGLARDFASMNSIHWGDLRNLHIQAGESSAMVMVELPISYETGGKTERTMFRYALGLKKEAGAWKISAGLASVPSAAGNYELAV